MAEDGESPRMIEATRLRVAAASGLTRMRKVADQTALGGQGDLRPEIERVLGVANTQLAQDRDRLGGAPREPVTRTQKGAVLLAQLAGEVGHQLPSSATVAVETIPAVAETKSASSSILNTLKSLLKR